MNRNDVFTNLVNTAFTLREEYLLELNKLDNYCYNIDPAVDRITGQKAILADKLKALETSIRNVRLYMIDIDATQLSGQVRNRLDVIKMLF